MATLCYGAGAVVGEVCCWARVLVHVVRLNCILSCSKSAPEGQYEYAAGDHGDTGPLAQRWPLSQKQYGKQHYQYDAELVDGSNL